MPLADTSIKVVVFVTPCGQGCVIGRRVGGMIRYAVASGVAHPNHVIREAHHNIVATSMKRHLELTRFDPSCLVLAKQGCIISWIADNGARGGVG